jgi:hypothetical protein
VQFQEPYLNAMWERAPKMLIELRRSGQLTEHLKEKRVEAHVLLRRILAGYRNPTAAEERAAEEEVLAILTKFPPEEVPILS